MSLFTLCICVGLDIIAVGGVVRDISWGGHVQRGLGKRQNSLLLGWGFVVAAPKLEV